MIVAQNLVKHYDNGMVKAVNGVTIHVEKGEIVALMGHSGSGKSTLLNVVGTIDRPTSGDLFIEKRNVREIKDRARFRAEYIGFVFQFHHLLPHLTLRENVEIPMYTRSVARRERRERALQFLTHMRLAERAHFLPSNVSGGERQRAAIARALANDPKIILADEPTGSVDTETGTAILDYLTAYCRKRDVSMIIATHNHEIALRTDRILRLKNGELEE